MLEYKVRALKIEDHGALDIAGVLNLHAHEGWELVSTNNSITEIILFLKREKKKEQSDSEYQKQNQTSSE